MYKIRVSRIIYNIRIIICDVELKVLSVIAHIIRMTKNMSKK